MTLGNSKIKNVTRFLDNVEVLIICLHSEQNYEF